MPKVKTFKLDLARKIAQKTGYSLDSVDNFLEALSASMIETMLEQRSALDSKELEYGQRVPIMRLKNVCTVYIVRRKPRSYHSCITNRVENVDSQYDVVFKQSSAIENVFTWYERNKEVKEIKPENSKKN